MAKSKDANLLLTLRCSTLDGPAFRVGLFLESAISSELLKAEWEKTNLRADKPLTEALFNGYWTLKEETETRARLLRDHGQLLLAWSGTTALQGGAA